MRFLRMIAPVLVALSVGISYGLGAAVPQPWTLVQDQSNPHQTTIRIHVRLVAVEVIVTDAQHAPVRDLKKENFQIFDDGRRQEIQHFTIKASNTLVSQPQSPPPGMMSFPAPNVMPDITWARGSIDSGAGAGACSPEAAAPMVAYVRAMLAERMAKSNDRFSMANLTAQVRYQLGYYPDGDDWDGRYRKIEVKVDRRRV